MKLRRAASWFALALVLGAGPVVAGERFPKFSAPVVDVASVVDEDDEQRINAELIDYQERSGNQISVAVVETTGRASLEDYSEDLFDAWQVGERGKDNGALLVIAMRERDIRIEVGYGLEGELTDLESGEIVDSMGDLMRAGEVGAAIELATTQIRRTLGDTEAGPPPPPAAPTEDEGRGSWFPIVFGLIPLFFILGGFGRRGRRRRRWDLGPILWGGGIGGIGGSGGGFGGGFGGGGFGGGGGGGSGGGGASGGW